MNVRAVLLLARAHSPEQMRDVMEAEPDLLGQEHVNAVMVTAARVRERWERRSEGEALPEFTRTQVIDALIAEILGEGALDELVPRRGGREERHSARLAFIREQVAQGRTLREIARELGLCLGHTRNLMKRAMAEARGG